MVEILKFSRRVMHYITVRINSTKYRFTIELHLNGRFLLTIKAKTNKIKALILHKNSGTALLENIVFGKSVDDLIVPWHLVPTLEFP